jgi:hypothetical protein
MPPDRALAYEQVSWPGFSRTFEAQRKISINTENASAVGVKVNGRTLASSAGAVRSLPGICGGRLRR